MPGYGDVVDGFNGTFNHHLFAATGADEHSNDPVVLEIYIMGMDVVIAFASHEFVDVVFFHGRPGFLLRI